MWSASNVIEFKGARSLWSYMVTGKFLGDWCSKDVQGLITTLTVTTDMYWAFLYVLDNICYINFIDEDIES